MSTVKVGQLELQPTQATATYQFGDDSGYKFTLTTIKDDEYGWQAHVVVHTYGFNSPEASVKNLAPAIEHLLKLLNPST